MLLGGAWDCGHALTYDKLQKDLNLPTLGGFVECVFWDLVARIDASRAELSLSLGF